MKLGLMGVTLLAAAGDDGAPGYDVRDGDLTCGYHPIFPATSPYVTAVGATQVNKGFCKMHIILYKLKYIINIFMNFILSILFVIIGS